jgi:hypothetical protein
MIAQRLRFALIATTLLTALSANGQIKVEANAGLLAVKISEEIVPGDYEKLLQGLRANPGQHKRKVNGLRDALTKLAIPNVAAEELFEFFRHCLKPVSYDL